MSYPLSTIDTATPDVGLKTGADKINAAIDLLNGYYPRFRDQTGSYTLQLSDLGYVIRLRGADMTITIPSTATVAWPVGAMITLIAFDFSVYTLSAVTGVNLNSVNGGSCTLTQFARNTIQRGTGEGWVVSGDHGTIT